MSPFFTVYEDVSRPTEAWSRSRACVVFRALVGACGKTVVPVVNIMAAEIKVETATFFLINSAPLAIREIPVDHADENAGPLKPCCRSGFGPQTRSARPMMESIIQDPGRMATV